MLRVSVRAKQEAASQVAQEDCCNRRAFSAFLRAAVPHAISNRRTPELLEIRLTRTKHRTKYFLIANFSAFFKQLIDPQLTGNVPGQRRVSLPWLRMRPIWMAPCPR